jgi:hypothetical protein
VLISIAAIVQKRGSSCRQIYRENLGGRINATDLTSPQDIGIAIAIGIGIANRNLKCAFQSHINKAESR